MAKVSVINESNEERFKRIATSRTNAVLDKLRLLGNLSNTHIYDYSDDDVEKIFSTINQQIKEVRAKFRNQKKERFEL